MVRCSSSVPPTHGSTPSLSPSCPLLLCLSIACFLYLPFFSAISFLSPPVVCPFLHSSSSFTSIVLSSTGCLFHLPLPRPPPMLISSILSSSPNYLSTFILLSLLSFPPASLTPPQPPPSPSPSISRFPPRPGLLGTLYLLSPSLAACVYYLLATEAGETGRTSPREDFHSAVHH